MLFVQDGKDEEVDISVVSVGGYFGGSFHLV